jgi:hypothetical protein
LISGFLSGIGRPRRWLPLAVVLVVILLIASNAVSSLQSNHESFAFNVNWPTPSAYVPGTTPPSAYLEINYTGPGEGNYTYTISYNSSSGVVAYQESALVSSVAPFRDYIFINTPPNETVVVTVQVFGGSESQGQLLFTKSVTI